MVTKVTGLMTKVTGLFVMMTNSPVTFVTISPHGGRRAEERIVGLGPRFRNRGPRPTVLSQKVSAGVHVTDTARRTSNGRRNPIDKLARP